MTKKLWIIKNNMFGVIYIMKLHLFIVLLKKNVFFLLFFITKIMSMCHLNLHILVFRFFVGILSYVSIHWWHMLINNAAYIHIKGHKEQIHYLSHDNADYKIDLNFFKKWYFYTGRLLISCYKSSNAKHYTLDVLPT